jgi:hypothetical protein
MGLPWRAYVEDAEYGKASIRAIRIRTDVTESTLIVRSNVRLSFSSTGGRAVKEIRVLHRNGHTTTRDVTDCVGSLERSGISAHSRREEPGYGTVMVNEDSDKDRALQILRDQGYEVVDV